MVVTPGIAAELARERGVEVRQVCVADDVGIDDIDHAVGRRGTGATIIVEKMAGAAAEMGASVNEVKDIAEHAAASSASFGVALSSCSPPGRGPIFDLAASEIEVGVGIHGEPGRKRTSYAPVADLVDEAVHAIMDHLEPRPESVLLAFVSGLGATTLMEQFIAYREVERAVAAAGFGIARRLVGPYVTALDMAGLLVTLTVLDSEMIELWDAPVHTPALRW